MQTFPRGDIPQLHLMVIASTGEILPVGTKSNRPSPVLMPLTISELCECMSIPNLNIAFGIASRKTFAVGTKSNPDDTAKGFGKDSLTDVAPSKIDIV